MKRVIAVLLVCLLVLPLCMVTAFATDTGYSFTFLEDASDEWDVVGDMIPDGRYMVEYWKDNVLLAYTSSFEFKKENCIDSWIGVPYTDPIAGSTSNESFYFFYSSSYDKMIVTVPDLCDVVSEDRPNVEIRFVPVIAEAPERLLFVEFQNGQYMFMVTGPFESGVYTFVLRTPYMDTYYRTEPVEFSFIEDPSDPYALIAEAYTYVIIEDQKVPVEVLAFKNKDYKLLVLDLGDEERTPLIVELEGAARTDSENDSVVNQLSTVANSFFETIGVIAEKIVSEPLLLMTVGIFFIGGCIAIFARFLRRE